MTPPGPRRAGPYLLAALLAALPFVTGPLSGRPLYFRDLSLYFFPLRGFVLEGLRAGALRFWNPFVHEGEPLALPPIAYPLDLLQLLRPDELGMSLVLALHVPLAALWMMALGRRGLGLAAPAAAAGALVYALGGFALSTVNLYVYVQALAWAPAVVLALLLAARGDRRAVGLAALAVGTLLTTTAAEVAAQALVVGLVLALPCSRAGAARLLAALALGAALAAPVALVVARVAADSARAAGFPAEVVLAHSVHPLTLVQVIVSGFHGDPARLADRWWGANFFPRGFPYFLSLYLGLGALTLAALGIAGGRGPRRRLALIAAIGALLALGRWGPAAPLVDALDVVRRFRYPVKAFFSVHFAVALLAAMGLDSVLAARERWRRLAAAAGLAGLVLAGAPLWPRIFPTRARWFAAGFFPPEMPGADRLVVLDWVLRDAATGAAVALVIGAVAWMAARGRLSSAAAAWAVAGLLAADLLRAGLGLNPSVPAGFFAPSPEIARHLDAWRAAGRVFTCDPAASQAYAIGRATRADHEQWTFAVLRDSLAPSFNVRARVASALSPDLTMLVPPQRLIDYADAGCPDIGRLVGPMRAAGVARVISADPLAHPDLALETIEAPAALAPVSVHAYALRAPLALIEATPPAAVAVRRRDPGHFELAVDAPAGATLVVREAWAAGWQGQLDGAPAAIARADGRHMAIIVPAGAHTVRLDYRAPGARLGAAIGLSAALLALALLAWPPRRSPAASTG